jgi:hypothetical protein
MEVPLVQAAGHGLLKLSSKRKDAVIKPTTSTEARFYEYVFDDDLFAPIRRFIPRHFATHSVPEVDARHPTHTHEVEIENLCLLESMHDRSSDEDLTTEYEMSASPGGYASFHASTSSAPRIVVAKTPSASSESAASLPASTKASLDGEAITSRGADAGGGEVSSTTLMLPRTSLSVASGLNQSAATPVTPPATRTQWSAPSVLDIKVGRIRFGPSTDPAKVKRIQEKDDGITTSTIALRVCGLHHERRAMEHDPNSSLQPPVGAPLSQLVAEDAVDRGPSMSETASDEEDVAEHAMLRYYETMQSQRREPVSEDSCRRPARGGRRRGRKWHPRHKRMMLLGRRIEWKEGKQFGREIDREGMVDALARFCTCIESKYDLRTKSLESDGETLLPSFTDPLSDKASGGVSAAFEPQPHLPLVYFYRNEAASLLRLLDTSRVLEHYSFVSSSVILIHDFHVKVFPLPIATNELAPLSPPAFEHAMMQSLELDDQVKFRARLRIVDFSSSGRIADGTVFRDNDVGFRDGIANLVALLDDVVTRYRR